ncbi:protein-L-isoaspartate O-methyltransferase family protein [Sphingomonas kyungheensis]|uniref:Protein-L-isoaspartate O-methyltransferase n=1 Tax=Sphingomonas kyungheensis TaxID=1069987 RepID=A0ABU8H239_9SPHN
MNITADTHQPDAAELSVMRQAMVASQLRTNAVNDQRVLVAMNTVPREEFVPAESRALAYRDTALPVAGGRAINLPMVIGRLLTEAYLEKNDRVLLIAAAGGYTAALLAQIVAEVVAVEEDATLLGLARQALAATPNVTLVEAPLREGHAAAAPYDVLIVDGAVEHLPETLIDQVKVGGRVVTGLIENGVVRLASGRKTEGGFGLAPFLDCDCVTLPGFARPQGFRF